MNIKLLFADDSITMQKVMELTLEREKVSVSFASDGNEAVSLATHLMPDVIVADVSLPIKDGYELCATLKKSAATFQIPVILISGEMEKYDSNRGSIVGADGHITKPFKADEFLSLINSLARKAKEPAVQALAEAEPTLNEPMPMEQISIEPVAEEPAEEKQPAAEPDGILTLTASQAIDSGEAEQQPDILADLGDLGELEEEEPLAAIEEPYMGEPYEEESLPEIKPVAVDEMNSVLDSVLGGDLLSDNAYEANGDDASVKEHEQDQELEELTEEAEAALDDVLGNIPLGNLTTTLDQFADAEQNQLSGEAVAEHDAEEATANSLWESAVKQAAELTDAAHQLPSEDELLEEQVAEEANAEVAGLPMPDVAEQMKPADEPATLSKEDEDMVRREVHSAMAPIINEKLEQMLREEVRSVVEGSFAEAMPRLVSMVEDVTTKVTHQLAEELIKQHIEQIKKGE